MSSKGDRGYDRSRPILQGLLDYADQSTSIDLPEVEEGIFPLDEELLTPHTISDVPILEESGILLLAESLKVQVNVLARIEDFYDDENVPHQAVSVECFERRLGRRGSQIRSATQVNRLFHVPNGEDACEFYEGWLYRLLKHLDSHMREIDSDMSDLVLGPVPPPPALLPPLVALGAWF